MIQVVFFVHNFQLRYPNKWKTAIKLNTHSAMQAFRIGEHDKVNRMRLHETLREM
jgi:hypothetical protein